MIPHHYQKQFAALNVVPGNDQLCGQFSQLGGATFESEIRTFLNNLNQLTRINPRVVSLPCCTIQLCDQTLDCPTYPGKTESEFWLDFNLCSERITAYCLAPYNDCTTQISGTVTQSQNNWEILTIYPEMIDVLDMDATGDRVILKFTMSEPIRDICEWAPDVSGEIILVELKVSALDSNFHSIHFTEIVSEDSPKACLIRILTQLQDLFYDSSSHNLSAPNTPRAWQLRPFCSGQQARTSVAISPITLRDPGPRENVLFSGPSRKSSDAPFGVKHLENQSAKEAIALSPFHCSYLIDETAPRLHAESVISSTNEGKIQTIEPSVDVQDIHHATEHSESKTVLFCTRFPESNGHVLAKQSNEVGDTNMKLDHSLVDTLVKSQSVSKNTSTLRTDGEGSPERQRRAATHRSPVLVLPVQQPLIKDTASTEELCQPNPLVTELTSKSEYNSPKHSPLLPVSLQVDTSVVGSAPSQPESVLPDSHLVTADVELRELSICLSRCMMTPPTVEKISASASDKRFATPIQQVANELAEARPRDTRCSRSPTLKGNLKSPVDELFNSPGQINLSELSSSSDVTPNQLSNLCRKYSANSTAVARDRLTGASTKTTRKLCDVSTSYLLDSSPINLNYQLTPEEYTIISLPKLSTEVRFPARSSAITKGTTKGRDYSRTHPLFEENPDGDPTLCLHSHSDSSDSDYQPPAKATVGLTPSTRRHSLRSAKTIKSTKPQLSQSYCMDQQLDYTSQVDTTAQQPSSQLPSSQLTSTPTQVVLPSPYAKPVSSMKKRRFFASSRSERLDREKKRFEQACRITLDELKNKKKKTVKNAPTSSVDTKMSAVSTTKIRSRKPTLSQAIDSAVASQAMPTDSDLDFVPEILDSEDTHKPRCNSHSAESSKVAVPKLETVIKDSECEEVIPASWESAVNSQCKPTEPASHFIHLEASTEPDGFPHSSSEDLEAFDDVLSAAPSLFAPTPPPSNPKSKAARKVPAKFRAEPLQLIQELSKAVNSYPSDRKEFRPEIATSLHQPCQPLISLPKNVNARNVDLDITQEDLAAEAEFDHFDFREVRLHQASFERSPSPPAPIDLCLPEEETDQLIQIVQPPLSFASLIRRLSAVKKQVAESTLAHERLGLRWSDVQKEITELKAEAQLLQRHFLASELVAQ
ncbi:hypothetical protein PHET_03138 [Paragonimus heterotremus]|uniref:Synaptonemal complex protein 2 Spt16M-like domain-containing protein n=1 Tax=Paragonimus heterotremus TaxID=100268 RepID=A0A8J4TNV0_9TREM|nr:hypothetical protein PHET_03138 [Paragonimus heterotremus]